MATIGGAHALGMADRIGSLEQGKRADVIVVQMDRPRQSPIYDPVSHIVYTTRGDDVDTVIVNGKVLMRRRVMRTLNPVAIMADARAAAVAVRAAVTR